MTSPQAAALVAMVLIAGCGRDRDRPPREGMDAMAPGSPTLHWNEELRGVDRLWVSGGGLVGQWRPIMAERPAPQDLRVFRTVDGPVDRRDRGWILHPGLSTNEIVVLDEAASPLTYELRRIGDRGGLSVVPLPAPDDGATWALRDVACGRDAGLCAVIRWSPRPGSKAARGEVERLAISVVDPGGPTVQRAFVVELADLRAGSDHLGGAAANPTEPLLYLVERRAEEPSTTQVRAFDLRTGAQRWAAAVAHLGAAGDDVELVVTPNGQHLVLALGETRWGTLQLHQLTVLDALSGAQLGSKDPPAGWRHVELLPGHEGSSIVALQIGVVGGGESPTFSFNGVSTFDTASGTISVLYDPAAAATTEAERDRARWKTPSTGVVLGADELLLVPWGNSTTSADDQTSAEVSRRRGALIDGLLAP